MKLLPSIALGALIAGFSWSVKAEGPDLDQFIYQKNKLKTFVNAANKLKEGKSTSSSILQIFPGLEASFPGLGTLSQACETEVEIFGMAELLGRRDLEVPAVDGVPVELKAEIALLADEARDIIQEVMMDDCVEKSGKCCVKGSDSTQSDKCKKKKDHHCTVHGTLPKECTSASDTCPAEETSAGLF